MYCSYSIDNTLKKIVLKIIIDLYEIIQINYTILKGVIPLLMEMKEIAINLLIYPKTRYFIQNCTFRLFFWFIIVLKIFISNKEIQEIFREFFFLPKKKKSDVLDEHNILIVFNPSEREFKEFTRINCFVDRTELILKF